MNKLAKYILFSFLATCSLSSLAAYPDFTSGYICSGLSDVTGVVDLYTPAQTYKSYYGVYIRLRDKDQKQYGGMLYQRNATELAYRQLTNVALISLITKSQVRMCYSGDEVYALELMG